MAVFPPYLYTTNTKDDGIASSILVVQLQMMYWRIDGVSVHRYETGGTRNGRRTNIDFKTLILLSSISIDVHRATDVVCSSEIKIKRTLDATV